MFKDEKKKQKSKYRKEEMYTYMLILFHNTKLNITNIY